MKATCHPLILERKKTARAAKGPSEGIGSTRKTPPIPPEIQSNTTSKSQKRSSVSIEKLKLFIQPDRECPSFKKPNNSKNQAEKGENPGGEEPTGKAVKEFHCEAPVRCLRINEGPRTNATASQQLSGKKTHRKEAKIQAGRARREGKATGKLCGFIVSISNPRPKKKKHSFAILEKPPERYRRLSLSIKT